MIRDRLLRVQDRVDAAARRVGRSPEEITIVGVSKTKSARDIREAYEAGLRDFGENYVQEFEAKSRELGETPGAVFHFIGKLQSNKAKPAAKMFQVIQTVDSEKLARRLNGVGALLDVFLEVKLSAEEEKGGVAEALLPELQDFVRSCPNLRLRGLMTMPPWFDSTEQARPYFRRLRELAARSSLQELSMGMSHDLEIAIEEGATMIRVGTAIFGERVYRR